MGTENRSPSLRARSAAIWERRMSVAPAGILDSG